MKKILLLLIPVMLITVQLWGSKIAIVDMQRVITEVKQGKKAMDGLKKEAKAKEKDMKSKQAELMALQKELQALMNNPAADKSKILEKQKEGQKKVMIYQQEAQKFQKDLARKEQKAAAGILKKAQGIVMNIVKKEKFDMVINKAAILYAPESNDITNQVIREYDKKYK